MDYISVISETAWHYLGIRAVMAPRVVAAFALPESLRLPEKSGRQQSMRCTPEWQDQTDDTQCTRHTACYSVAWQCPSVAAAPLRSSLATREVWVTVKMDAIPQRGLRGSQPFLSGDVQTHDRYGSAKKTLGSFASEGFSRPGSDCVMRGGKSRQRNPDCASRRPTGVVCQSELPTFTALGGDAGARFHFRSP